MHGGWRKRIKVAVIGAVFLALLIAVAVLVRVSGGRAAVQELPDGSTIQVVETSWSTNLTYQGSEPKWRRTVRRMMPQSLGAKLLPSFPGGTLSLGSSSGGPKLACFTMTSVANAKNLNLVGNARAVAFDCRGNSVELGQSFGAMEVGGSPNNYRIDAWVFRAFPRREKLVGLRILLPATTTAEGWEKVAEFEVENPAHQKYPQWVPEALPITKSDGDLKVELVKFVTGLTWSKQPRPATGNERAGTQMEFRVLKDGKTNHGWRAATVEIADATGNRWTPHPIETIEQWDDGQETLWVDQGLWSGEAAWKLRVEYVRAWDFDPAETVKFRDVPIPAPMESITLTNQAVLNGLEVSLGTITGTQREQPRNLKWLQTKQAVNVLVQVKNLPPNKRITLAAVTDPNGGRLQWENANERWQNDKQVYGLRVSPEVKSVNLTVVVQASRYVEFLAKPKDARTAGK